MFVIAALVEDVNAETVAAVVKLAYIVKTDVQVEDVVMLVEVVVRVEGDVAGVTAELLAAAHVGVEKFGAAEIVVEGVDTEVAVLEIAAVVQSDAAREKEY